MTANFNLLRPKDKKGKLRPEPVSITLTACNKGTRVGPVVTSLKIIPSFWNEKAQEVKASFIDHEEINDELTAIKKRLVESWKSDKGAKAEVWKGLVLKAISGEDGQPIQKKSIEPWILSFIETSKVKPPTKQVYKATLQHLKNFIESPTGINYSLQWESFTLDFYESFTSYLYKIGHNDNTVGKYIKTLKTFITQAFDRNLHANLAFKKKSFKVTQTEVDEVYLPESEVIAFYNVTGLDPEVEESKKKFVFDCWVGLRFSDLKKLNPNHLLTGLNGRPMLQVTTEKTGEQVLIPLHPVALEIWNSWKGIPPEMIDNPTFNKHIKLIAEKAKINTPVQKRNTIQGNVKVTWVPKYEMVKAHTARRSFATNCHLIGIPKATIMSVTGHKTEKAFNRYLRVSKEQHANIMADFFEKESVHLNKAVLKIG